MAITKIHPIKSTLKKAIDYIVDPAKTDDKLLVSSFGCAVEPADLEFEKTRLLAMQKGNNLAHQLIQAFEPGEVSYAQAHEIGRQLADEILGGKYEYVIATHINKEHCHKVICLIPSNDGRIYELRKMEQGEFIAPKKNVVDFSEVRAGFSPALPKIPAELMGQIIAFFRAFMTDHGENEAFAQIYWDKAEKRFFAYVPKQSVCKEEVEADLHDCPYDDEERYLCYADIHSHNSMDAFFSGKDDQDERSTGLYLVLGKLDKFYPDVKARIFCGDSFVSIDPNIVMEGLEQPFPKEWLTQVSIRSRKSERFKKPDKRSFRDLLEEAFL